MPLYIDPEWEYWTPSPEIAESMEPSESIHSLSELVDARSYDRDFVPFQFFSGNPNRMVSRLAPKNWKGANVIKCVLSSRECPTCRFSFVPTRSRQKYCTKECRPYPGRERERPMQEACSHCKAIFEPLWKGNTYCSSKCVRESLLTRRIQKLEDKQNSVKEEFVKLWNMGASRKEICERLSISVPTLKRWRRDFGLSARPSGNPSWVPGCPWQNYRKGNGSGIV